MMNARECSWCYIDLEACFTWMGRFIGTELENGGKGSELDAVIQIMAKFIIRFRAHLLKLNPQP